MFEIQQLYTKIRFRHFCGLGEEERTKFWKKRKDRKKKEKKAENKKKKRKKLHRSQKWVGRDRGVS